jgi:MFS family permease
MKRLRWYDYITVNIFWLGLNIRNTALGSIFMPYLVAIFAPEAIKNTALGAMRSAGLVIAMLVQPAAGMVSDRSTARFGRRRPFILVGALFDCLFLLAIALSQNYWALLISILLIQFSSNVSHGPLQGLIPDLVPEDQRSHAAAVKSIMELLPVVLVGLTIAKMVGAGYLDWAIFATGAALLVVTLITMIFVKETPLQERPTTPFWPPMLRVLGMLGGVAIGAVAGALSGGLVGGLAGLVTLTFASQPVAISLAIGVGGGVAMIVAVVVGVWAGVAITLRKNKITSEVPAIFRIFGLFSGYGSGFVLGGLAGAAVFLALPVSFRPYSTILGVMVASVVAIVAGARIVRAATLDRDAGRELAPFAWWTANRLMFLAAVTSLQGSIFYFLMYAFKLTNEGASSLTGTITAVIGGLIILTAIFSGWIANWVGRRRLVWISGFVAAVGNVLLLATIWIPQLSIVYVAGAIIGTATGLFMTANWALGTDLVPAKEAGRYLGISNLAGAGAGIVGAGIGGLVADAINHYFMGLGYFAVFAAYAVLFALSAITLTWVKESASR